jgi:hypothetical protein
MTVMPARLTPMIPHPVQHAYAVSQHRFNVVPAGRRSGKTEIAKRRIIRRALRGTAFDHPRFFAGAPTREQAKGIFWEDLKRMTPPSMIQGRPSETELSIRLKHGSSIWVVGFDKPERFEGRPWDGGCLDEYGNTKETVWTNNVEPALADRNGWCDFIGVPEGRNHYYDLHERARTFEMSMGDASDWATFHWKSADILPKEAIAAARRNLDELTFQQEYEASFVNFEGRAYYPFLEATHAKKLSYSVDHPLALCFDFNVAPGVAAVAQEQILPDGALGTGIIGEVWIPQNSNTPAVCRKLISMIGKHRGRVTCYGDHTGGARGTAKVTGTDWNIIADELRPIFGDRLYFQVPVNPPERARVNAMNTRLLAGDGTIRMMVDPSKAPQTVRDFEGVRLLKGGSGEIDKKIDPMRTHLTDAIGYYVHSTFPLHRQTVTSQEFRL